MLRYRRRRVHNIIILLGIAGFIFIVFQLFSLEVLSFHSKNEDRKARNSFSDIKKVPPPGATHMPRNGAVEEDCEDGKCEIKESKEPDEHHIKNKYDKIVHAGFDRYGKKVKDMHMMGSTTKNIAKAHDNARGSDDCFKVIIPADKYVWTFLEMCFLSSTNTQDINTSPDISGVPKTWNHLYLPDAKGFFTCIKSKEKIPFDRINDNYCDCDDSTDEPGTSACADSRFYCGFQLSDSPSRWVSPVKVDDGICDCCDGSDEPSRHLLPGHVHMDKDAVFFGVRQAPCTDRCADLRKQELNVIQIRQRGSKVKEDYIKAAEGADNPNDIYGPDGAFYKLSKECFKADFDKYKYEVCPFREVKQTWSAVPYKTIGRKGEWVSTGDSGWKLLMSHGEPTQCPEGRPRVTFIVFSCGIQDAVLYVSETEVCEYTVKFSTPAAC